MPSGKFFENSDQSIKVSKPSIAASLERTASLPKGRDWLDTLEIVIRNARREEIEMA
jgi:hypothetical protein